jgi:hypothetical protein
MKVQKDGIQYEAEQIIDSPKDVPYLGLTNVPAGHWIISDEVGAVQCPSDEGFKENYTPVTGTVKATTVTRQQIPNDTGE